MLPTSIRFSPSNEIYGHVCGTLYLMLYCMWVNGAYAPLYIQNLHNESEGSLVHGYTQNMDVLSKTRVMLAPLRFGEGIKGVIVDS